VPTPVPLSAKIYKKKHASASRAIPKGSVIKDAKARSYTTIRSSRRQRGLQKDKGVLNTAGAE